MNNKNLLKSRDTMEILVLDNYDSFTYNLVHLVKKLTECRIKVARNDKIEPEEVQNYDKIIISPGPGIPEEAGIMKEIIRRYCHSKSILGVCLGMQGIAEVFGGHLYNMDEVYHGIETKINIIKNDRIFQGLPPSIKVGRYHSWAVNRKSLPNMLEITANDEDSVVMAIRHKQYDVQGLQFHPESIMTPYGQNILSNWLNAENKNLNFPSQNNTMFNMNNIQKGYLFC